MIKIILNLILLNSFILISEEVKLYSKIKFQDKKYYKNKNHIMLSRKEEKNNTQETTKIDERRIYKEIDLLVNNISEKYENEIFNLTLKIDNIINASLGAQNEIIQKSKSEKIMINKMLNDIKLLKEKYNQNIIHTYILCGIIIALLLFFCVIDFLKKGNSSFIPSGYHKTIEDQNNNNQITIV